MGYLFVLTVYMHSFFHNVFTTVVLTCILSTLSTVTSFTFTSVSFSLPFRVHLAVYSTCKYAFVPCFLRLFPCQKYVFYFSPSKIHTIPFVLLLISCKAIRTGLYCYCLAVLYRLLLLPPSSFLFYSGQSTKVRNSFVFTHMFLLSFLPLWGNSVKSFT